METQALLENGVESNFGRGVNSLRLRLSGEIRCVPFARNAVLKQLHQIGILPASAEAVGERADEALLIAAELLSNAQRHTEFPILLEIEWHDARRALTLSVSDGSPLLPEVCPLAPGGSTQGYGMYMVQLLADDWWVTKRCAHRGKIVHALVIFPASAPSA